VPDRAGVELTDRITRLVSRILEKRGIVRILKHDEELRSAGLSSLDQVNLMLAVEMEFAIKIAEREMTPANFRSIASIADLVGRCMQPVPTA
jgi:acyl carrier protein